MISPSLSLTSPHLSSLLTSTSVALHLSLPFPLLLSKIHNSISCHLYRHILHLLSFFLIFLTTTLLSLSIEVMQMSHYAHGMVLLSPSKILPSLTSAIHSSMDHSTVLSLSLPPLSHSPIVHSHTPLKQMRTSLLYNITSSVCNRVWRWRE